MKETKQTKERKDMIITLVVSISLLLFIIGLIYFLEYNPDRTRLNIDCYWDLKKEIERDFFNEECIKYNGFPLGEFWVRGEVRTLICQKDSPIYEEVVLVINTEWIEEQAEEECKEYKQENSFKYLK